MMESPRCEKCKSWPDEPGGMLERQCFRWQRVTRFDEVCSHFQAKPAAEKATDTKELPLDEWLDAREAVLIRAREKLAYDPNPDFTRALREIRILREERNRADLAYKAQKVLTASAEEEIDRLQARVAELEILAQRLRLERDAEEQKAGWAELRASALADRS